MVDFIGKIGASAVKGKPARSVWNGSAPPPPPPPPSSLDDTSELTLSGKMPGRIITDNNVVSSGWRSTVQA